MIVHGSKIHWVSITGIYQDILKDSLILLAIYIIKYHLLGFSLLFSCHLCNVTLFIVNNWFSKAETILCFSK